VTLYSYSCKLGVTELNIASRGRAVDGGRIASMIELARQMQLPFNEKDVKYVDWDSCP
jgi:hypothetical protein